MSNDVTIAGTIIFIFILLGGLLPFVQRDFETTVFNNIQRGVVMLFSFVSTSIINYHIISMNILAY